MINNNIIVIFGGLSNEHFISIASAQNIAKACGPCKCWYWDKNGLVKEICFYKLIIFKDPLKNNFNINSKKNWLNISQALDSIKNKNVVFFNALHGIGGEDGYVQRLLEKKGLSFTGSGSSASKLAFKKSKSKKIINNNNILVAPEIKFRLKDKQNFFLKLKNFIKKYKKVVFKPDMEGSSLGLIFCKSQKNLTNCLSKIKGLKKSSYLIEAFIEGLEITVGIVQNKINLKALSCIEISCSDNCIFNYQAKYFSVGVNEIIPARISKFQMKKAQEIALIAHKLIGCSGYSRTDMIINSKGIYFLEINTLPGLSDVSLFTKELAYENISMNNFVKNQLELAC